MTSVLLVTCAWMPDGEPGAQLLLDAFAGAGADARWVLWDDPSVDWQAADVVAVRATWDYELRLAEFLAWARSVGPALLNGAHVFEWNIDKSYLVGLAAAGLPVVPTIVAEGEEDLPSAIAAYDRAVVKPCVGAGGRGVVLFPSAGSGGAGADGEPEGLDALGPGPWVVQPLVESVRTEGERSVYMFGGEPVTQVRKLPVGKEIRVHEWYGGSTVADDLDLEAADLARRAVAVAESIVGSSLTYGRVDQLRMPDGTLVVSEIELTEPGLYLDVLPQNAVPFAASVVDWVARSVRS